MGQPIVPRRVAGAARLGKGGDAGRSAARRTRRPVASRALGPGCQGSAPADRRWMAQHRLAATHPRPVERNDSRVLNTRWANTSNGWLAAWKVVNSSGASTRKLTTYSSSRRRCRRPRRCRWSAAAARPTRTRRRSGPTGPGGTSTPTVGLAVPRHPARWWPSSPAACRPCRRCCARTNGDAGQHRPGKHPPTAPRRSRPTIGSSVPLNSLAATTTTSCFSCRSSGPDALEDAGALGPIAAAFCVGSTWRDAAVQSAGAGPRPSGRGI